MVEPAGSPAGERRHAGAAILALEYDLFRFAGHLTAEQQRITLAELIFLSALLVMAIVAFIVRRLYEARRDTLLTLERQLDTERLRNEASRDPLTIFVTARSIRSRLSPRQLRDRATAAATMHFSSSTSIGFKRINDDHGHAVGDRDPSRRRRTLQGRFPAGRSPRSPWRR